MATHRQALAQAIELEAAPLALDALIGWGATGAGLCSASPAADRQTREELTRVLDELGIALSVLERDWPCYRDLAEAASALEAHGIHIASADRRSAR